MFFRSAIHRIPTLLLSALLLLLGGRLTAYITPGEFLGIGPTNDISVSSSSSASVPLPTLFGPAASFGSSAPLLPTLFGQTTSSVSSTYLLPTLFGPAAPSSSSAPLLPTLFGQTTSSVSSTYLLPTLSGAASSTTSHTTTTTGNGNNSTSTSRMSVGTRNTFDTRSAQSINRQFFGQSGALSSARIIAAPAYDAYYARVAATAPHRAPTLSSTVLAVPSSRSASSQLTVLPTSSAPASSSSLRSSSAAVIPTAVAVHAGAQPLPASGSPYVLALLLVLPAGWMVLRLAQRAERR